MAKPPVVVTSSDWSAADRAARLRSWWAMSA